MSSKPQETATNTGYLIIKQLHIISCGWNVKQQMNSSYVKYTSFFPCGGEDAKAKRQPDITNPFYDVIMSALNKGW